MVGFSQKGTQSPYSVYGIGELRQGQYAYFNALGGAQIANTDSTIITQSNPASYANIGRNRPIFQVGLNGKYSNLETKTSSASSQHFGLDQFQLGFPIKKNWGASFGLTPYSSTGYLISNPIIDGLDTLAMKINEGKGTISNFHIGTGFNQTLSTNTKLSVGVNFNYLFGNIEKIQSFEYATDPLFALHSRAINTSFVKDSKFDIGLTLEHKLKRHNFTVAGVYSPATKLTSSENNLAYAYSQSFYQNFSYNISIIDTNDFSESENGTTYIPESFTIGGEFRYLPKKGSGQNYSLIFKGELKQQNWSKYYTEYNNTKTDSVYKDRSRLSFGIEYAPQANARINNNLVPYLAKVRYRFGFNYTMSQIFIENTDLENYGISFGLGIPVLNGNSNTNLNIGLSYSAFGTTENNLIKENNLGFSFGVSISPGLYDRWFVKRKYD